MRALLLLALLGRGRKGALDESDLAPLRPAWTMKDVTKAFGAGRDDYPALSYPAWGSDDRYLFFFDHRSGLLTEVRRWSAATKDQDLVWPP